MFNVLRLIPYVAHGSSKLDVVDEGGEEGEGVSVRVAGVFIGRLRSVIMSLGAYLCFQVVPFINFRYSVYRGIRFRVFGTDPVR